MGGDMSDPITVFLLDDHEIVRRGLSDLLEHEGMTVVGVAGRARGAADAIVQSGATVAVLDGRLPDGSGIEVCRDVKSADPSIGCLILTSYDDDEAVLAAALAGANGYVLKELRTTALVDAIRRVSAGESLLDSGVTERVTARLTQSTAGESPLDALTPREKDVLALIAGGLSNREIGARLFLAEKTIKNNVSAIFSKLGVQRRTQAAVLAAEWSLREHPQPDPGR